MSNPDPSVVKPGFQNGSSSSAAPWFVGPEKKSSLSSLDWRKPGDMIQMNGAITTLHAGQHDSSADVLNSLLERPCELNGFSSSLPALLHEKLNLASRTHQSDDIRVNQDSAEEPLDQNMVTRAIGDILPNDDELLAGITADFMNNMIEENDDDLFSSGGGLEMDGETQEGFGMYMSRLDGFYGVMNIHGPPSSGPGSVIGEHPYGEHPSRTLFVRNINSNVEDSELQILFEQYGDIRTLYTACKHRGFVMISYYDIRAARSAMRALQNKPLRRRKLDIHFSIPKDNPSDKDVNQGTLVVFNLDASVSNDDLRQIFGQYGEVKEIRETPHKRHHKFIEFYDVRAAEAALRALNKSDIAGKRIKLEPSRPGGARRSLMQQLGQDPDQEDMRLYRQQSSPPVPNSPPGHFSSWGHFGSPLESGPVRFPHPTLGSSVPNMNKNLPNLPIPRVGTIGSHLGRNNQIDSGLVSLQSDLRVKGVLPHHPHSLPEYSNDITPFHNASSSITTTTTTTTTTSIRGAPSGPSENENSTRLLRTSSNLSLFEHAPGGPGMSSSQGVISGSIGSASLSGPQFLWGNSSSFQNSSPMVWSNSSSLATNFSGQSQLGEYSRINHPNYVNNTGLHSQRHHVGSAPPGDPSYLERQFSYVRESHDASYYVPGSVSSMNVPGMMSLGGSHNTNGFFEGGNSPNMGAMSPHHRSPMFPPTGMVLSSHFDMIGGDRGRIRRIENGVSQTDNKKQYQLDIDRILRGDDNRTTLMIKNIPNKYTSKMLLSTIDENHKGMYDFLYLPIDFKNKCNVGYAFINMTSPEHIIPIYQSFNGKKWEKFNSEKVVSLAYARIQGKAALVAHFQNSSLMNEDKRCRPILLNSDGPETNEQEAMYEGICMPPSVVSNRSEIMSKTDSQDGGSSSTTSSNSP